MPGILIFCLFAIIHHGAIADPEQGVEKPELWLNAVSIAEQNAHWVPGRWEEIETTFDSNGEIEEARTSIIRFLPGGEQRPEIKLESAWEGSHEVTSIARLEFDPAEYQPEPQDNPFDPSLQDLIKVTDLGRTRSVDGLLASGFAYQQQTASGRWAGTAWLERQSGAPLLLISHPLSMPAATDGLQIHDLELRNYYQLDDMDHWFPRRIELDLEISIQAGWLTLFRGHTQIRIVPTEYWY